MPSKNDVAGLIKKRKSTRRKKIFVILWLTRVYSSYNEFSLLSYFSHVSIAYSNLHLTCTRLYLISENKTHLIF